MTVVTGLKPCIVVSGHYGDCNDRAIAVDCGIWTL